MKRSQNDSVTPESAQESKSYRDLLEKTILNEWGPDGLIVKMIPGRLRPFSSQIYSLEKKWRSERELIPNVSEYLFKGGVQPHVALKKIVDQSLAFMSKFRKNPKQFTDEELKAARELMISAKRDADNVDIKAGWGYNPEKQMAIITANSKALVQQQEIENSTRSTNIVALPRTEVTQERTDTKPVTVNPAILRLNEGVLEAVRKANEISLKLAFKESVSDDLDALASTLRGALDALSEIPQDLRYVQSDESSLALQPAIKNSSYSPSFK